MKFLGCGKIETLAIMPNKKLFKETIFDGEKKVVKLKWVKRDD